MVQRVEHLGNPAVSMPRTTPSALVMAMFAAANGHAKCGHRPHRSLRLVRSSLAHVLRMPAVISCATQFRSCVT